MLDSTGNDAIDAVLAFSSTGDVSGIGSRRAMVLNGNTITNARHSRDAPDGWITQNMTIMELRRVWELRAVSCILMELSPLPKKAIARTRSFGKPVTESTDLKEAVATYMSHAGGRKLPRHPVDLNRQLVSAVASRPTKPSCASAHSTRVGGLFCGLVRVADVLKNASAVSLCVVPQTEQP